MTADPYSPTVRRLFTEPVHVGDVNRGVRSSLEAQGVRVHLSMQVSNGVIETMRFRAWGCPHLIAAAEAFCADVTGETVATLATYSVRGLMQTLAVPVEKTGRILVLEDAIQSLGNKDG